MDANSPLRRVRLEHGLTLFDVAKGTGIDTGQLSRIERGMQVSVDKAARLAKFFKGAVSELQILYPDRFKSAKRGRAKA